MPLSLPIFSRWATEGKFARVLEKANRDLDVDHVTSNKGGHHLSETIRKSDKELRKLIANMVQHAVAHRRERSHPVPFHENQHPCAYDNLRALPHPSQNMM